MRFSSAFKVGILTLLSFMILLFSIMWIKGRSLSTGKTYDVDFKDINGIRVGSAVQMMGVRIGQVESLTPIMNNEDSVVRVRLVITEPKMTIPKASTISIQQTGIIGELFVEISPPKTQEIYIPIKQATKVIHKNDNVEVLMDSKYSVAGKIKNVEVVDVNTLPLNIQNELKTSSAYKVGYIISLPGLILPERITAKIYAEGDISTLRIKPQDNVILPYPQTKSDFTIIEPTRLAEFMELQYKSAASLTETNQRISALLSDDVIADLKTTFKNLEELTERVNVTISKAELLIDASKNDLTTIIKNTNSLTSKMNTMVDNINSIVGDEHFKETMITTAKSVNRLSNNVSTIIEDKSTQEILANLQVASRNVSEITSYINRLSKDENLKKTLNTSLNNFNKATTELTKTLETVNSIATPEEQLKIKQTLSDTSLTVQNLRKFSEKLNKRFLIFRLLF